MSCQIFQLPAFIGRKPLFTLFLGLFLSFPIYAQFIQGEYTNTTIHTGFFSGMSNPNGCWDFELHIENSVLYDITGTQLYIFIDSIQGTSDSISVWYFGNQIQMYEGDSLSGQSQYYFYFYASSVVYYSMKRIGIPMISEEPYACELDSALGILVDGCDNLFKTYYSNSQECIVLGGDYTPSNDSCGTFSELTQGLNWVNNYSTSGNPDLEIPCFNDLESNTEESGVWYSFTTPSNPVKIELRTSSSQCDTIELVGTQMALFSSCDSPPIACSSPGDSLFAKLEFDCGELEPNTTYHVMVDGWAGEQGICRLYYNVYEVCEIPGCTDPEACNYDPSAIIDDGSCLYGNGCIPTIELTVDTIDCRNFVIENNIPIWPFPSSGFWTLNGQMYFDSFGSMILNDLEEGLYSICYYNQFQEGPSNGCIELYVPDSCDQPCNVEMTILGEACQKIFILDLPFSSDSTYSWDMGNGETLNYGHIATATYPADGNYTVCVNLNFYGCNEELFCTDFSVTSCDSLEIVYGCTDPDALNYNPDATNDNGTCIYPPECEFNIQAIPSPSDENALIILVDFDYSNVIELLWDFGDGNASTELYPSHTYVDSQSYELCCTATFATDTGTCSSMACITLIDPSPGGGGYSFSLNGGTTGIAKYNSSQRLITWPNPTNKHINWKLHEVIQSEINLTIRSVSGKSMNQVNRVNSNSGILSVKDLTPGVYILTIIGSFGSENSKFVVLK